MENKLINIGDIFAIYPYVFDFYAAGRHTIYNEEVGEQEAVFFQLDALCDTKLQYQVGETFDDMLLIVQYLGNGKIKELSTGKVFPIYNMSDNVKIIDGIYKAPNSRIDESRYFTSCIEHEEKAKKFLADANENTMAVGIYESNYIIFDIENRLSEYSKYSLEQRKALIELLEQEAVKNWEESKEKCNFFFESLDVSRK